MPLSDKLTHEVEAQDWNKKTSSRALSMETCMYLAEGLGVKFPNHNSSRDQLMCTEWLAMSRLKRLRVLQFPHFPKKLMAASSYDFRQWK